MSGREKIHRGVVSSARRSSAVICPETQKTSPLAFCGFVPATLPGTWFEEPLYSLSEFRDANIQSRHSEVPLGREKRRQCVYPTRLVDRSGRQRVSVSWGEQALDGIKHDKVELVRSALRQTFSDPQQRVEAAGIAGAPFSYANAAFFTQEQIDRVVDDLKERAREESAKSRCFVSDSKRVGIDKALREVGNYASVFISRATAGDTGLHLAITLGSLRAAMVFVEEGCEVAAVNEDGIGAADILRGNYEKIMNLVDHIGQLEEAHGRRSTAARRLTSAEKACLGQQERVTRKANEYRLFAHGLTCYIRKRLSVLPVLEEEAGACEIEGRAMGPVAERELRLCATMNKHLEQCEAIRGRDHPTLSPLDPVELELNAERFTRSAVRFGDPMAISREMLGRPSQGTHGHTTKAGKK